MKEYKPQELELLRNKSFYKMDSRSDFATIKECFKASKALYECLKFFDARCTRYGSEFSSVNQKLQARKRRYIYPSDYYSFKCFDVLIELRVERRSRKYVVVCSHFKPQGFEIVSSSQVSEILEDSATYLCCPTLDFSEALQNFNNVVAHFLEVRGVLDEPRIAKKYLNKVGFLPEVV